MNGVWRSVEVIERINMPNEETALWGVTKGDIVTIHSERYGVENRKLEDSTIITSAGISTRINLFGQLIIEPYYAFPLQLEGNDKGIFGINFTPGW